MREHSARSECGRRPLSTLEDTASAGRTVPKDRDSDGPYRRNRNGDPDARQTGREVGDEARMGGLAAKLLRAYTAQVEVVSRFSFAAASNA